jgi:predicted ATPase/class 3 adenylate cyclase
LRRGDDAFLLAPSHAGPPTVYIRQVPTELPTGTVTFLFTDIAGSTRLLYELGPETYAEALAEHRRIVRAAARAEGGVEVDTQGDAFFIAFPTAGGAATAAESARDRLAGGPIRVRMGLHTGVPTPTAGGYVGLDVHRGARIAALAHGEQILISPTTAALLDTEPLRDLGQHRLKDFDGAVRLHQLGDADFPPLRTPGSIELPTPAARFMGREQELFDAVSLVYDRDPRIFTILGPGGAGKTRFAIELARLLADDAEGGTVFVSLAPLRDPELVLPAMADRLGASAADSAAIAARVGERRTHVVCDNVEHLLPAAASPLAELVAAVPALRLIATSREALRVQGEAELDLPPLVRAEAIALFCERAQAVRPDVTGSDAVAQLCDRLDRLPLALELAAARTKLLAPEAILERLAHRLDALKGTRDVEERHATLRATIAWSYDLLDEDEQDLFARLGVFRGGCTLETAEIVCDADLDTLASLLDKSLLRRRTGRIGEERYWMLETITEFALERLQESGAEDDLRRRHAQRMLEIGRAGHLAEGDTESDLVSVLAEREDLRGALDWAEEDDPRLGLELMIETQNLWNASAPKEGMERMERLLARAGQLPKELRARALRVYSGTADMSGERARGEQPLRESLALCEELRDERGIALVEHMLAVWAWRREDWQQVRERADRSLAVSAGRFPFIETTNYWVLGQIALVDGDLERASELTRQRAELARTARWAWWESGQRHELMMLALRRGDLDDAEREGIAALEMERVQENRVWALYTLAGLAQLALARGDLERAGLLWGAAQKEGESLPRWPDERARRGGALLEEKREPFVDAQARGSELDLWDAAEIALAERA